MTLSFKKIYIQILNFFNYKPKYFFLFKLKSYCFYADISLSQFKLETVMLR